MVSGLDDAVPANRTIWTDSMDPMPWKHSLCKKRKESKRTKLATEKNARVDDTAQGTSAQDNPQISFDDFHRSKIHCLLSLDSCAHKSDQIFNWTFSHFQISPCSLTRNITPHRMKNVAVHSLFRWKMIILPNLTHYLYISLGWEKVSFELGSERLRHERASLTFLPVKRLSCSRYRVHFWQWVLDQPPSRLMNHTDSAVMSLFHCAHPCCVYCAYLGGTGFLRDWFPALYSDGALTFWQPGKDMPGVCVPLEHRFRDIRKAICWPRHSRSTVRALALTLMRVTCIAAQISGT